MTPNEINQKIAFLATYSNKGDLSLAYNIVIKLIEKNKFNEQILFKAANAYLKQMISIIKKTGNAFYRDSKEIITRY